MNVRFQTFDSVRIICRHVLRVEIGYPSADLPNRRVVQHVPLVLIESFNKRRVAEVSPLCKVSYLIGLSMRKSCKPRRIRT